MNKFHNQLVEKGEHSYENEMEWNNTLKTMGVVFIAFLFLVTCSSENTTTRADGEAVSGTYEGSADGYAGTIDVEVTLKNAK